MHGLGKNKQYLVGRGAIKPITALLKTSHNEQRKQKTGILPAGRKTSESTDCIPINQMDVSF
jgi:hypothetical protein